LGPFDKEDDHDRHPRHLREGVIAGSSGRPSSLVAPHLRRGIAASLRTPTLLRSAALQGVENPQAGPVSTDLVVQYTVLHGVVFALVGSSSPS
jgi:hypothetical protein